MDKTEKDIERKIIIQREVIINREREEGLVYSR